MIKLVVFDWNGVLIADAEACKDTQNHILKKYGRKPISLALWREINVVPAKNFFLKMGFSEAEMRKNARDIQEMFHAYYEPRANKVRTRRGARELLAWLSKNAVECVILSNHTEDGIQNQLARLGIKEYFSDILTNHMHTAMHKQNKRERLGAFLKKRRINKGQVLLLGDSPEEVEIGRYFGITTVAIMGGYYSTRRLKEAKPDYLIHKLSDMIDIIKKV